LIRKVYETGPLVCLLCQHPVIVVASIENPTGIRGILEHPGPWLANARSEPRVRSPPVHPLAADAFFSGLHAFAQDPPFRLPLRTLPAIGSRAVVFGLRILSFSLPAKRNGTSFSLTLKFLLSYSVPFRNKLPVVESM